MLGCARDGSTAPPRGPSSNRLRSSDSPRPALSSFSLGLVPPCESTGGDPFPLANLGALRAGPVHTSGRRRVPESRTVSNPLPRPASSRSLPIARCLYLEAVQEGPGNRPPPRSSPSSLRQT